MFSRLSLNNKCPSRGQSQAITWLAPSCNTFVQSRSGNDTHLTFQEATRLIKSPTLSRKRRQDANSITFPRPTNHRAVETSPHPGSLSAVTLWPIESLERHRTEVTTAILIGTCMTKDVTPTETHLGIHIYMSCMHLAIITHQLTLHTNESLPCTLQIHTSHHAVQSRRDRRHQYGPREAIT